jgi:oligoendopeptidase F
MRATADLFRPENLPLLAEEQKLSTQYDTIFGAQTVEWEGKEVTVSQLRPVYLDSDRTRRERAWLLASNRILADRQAINELWQKFLPLRQKIAANAGKPDYTAYRWQQLLRFDYTPADCLKFHKAIEKAVVPAASRIYERRRQRLGVDSLRPWDLYVDPLGRPPLHPFEALDELVAKTSTIFHQVDPQLGVYFDSMVREDLLDLDNRKNKAPGAYSAPLPMVRKPFLFMNAVGVHDDVQAMLHESGHSFHVYETAGIRYSHLLEYGMEFAEVASMGMELLASPYLEAGRGGFYTPAEAARAVIEVLEGQIIFLLYMAVVDAFQQWVYANPQQAMDPTECDAAYGKLYRRFMPGVDWSGLEGVMTTRWQRQSHIHEVPFYYVEYGLAQLGAVQVWRNALSDQAGAVKAYRHALSLGGSVTLPELYRATGVRFAFDAGTLGEAVALMESKISELERI